MAIEGAFFVEFDSESDSDDEDYYIEAAQFNLANMGVQLPTKVYQQWWNLMTQQQVQLTCSPTTNN